MMDITKTTEPKSDQQNFDDYVAGPKTVTIADVKSGSAEQPVEIHLVEYPGRPFKPSKSMRRVLVAAWGAEASAYVGRRMTLYGDPTVRFGGIAVGGIRISHLSDIDKTLTLALTVKRGSRSPFIVQPLEQPKDTSGRDWLVELADTQGDVDLISGLGNAAKAAHAAPAILTVIRAAYLEAKKPHEQAETEAGR
jgi:hypothetical protein